MVPLFHTSLSARFWRAAAASTGPRRTVNAWYHVGDGQRDLGAMQGRNCEIWVHSVALGYSPRYLAGGERVYNAEVDCGFRFAASSSLPNEVSILSTCRAFFSCPAPDAGTHKGNGWR